MVLANTYLLDKTGKYCSQHEYREERILKTRGRRILFIERETAVARHQHMERTNYSRQS